jgi:hypothetical protein
VPTPVTIRKLSGTVRVLTNPYRFMSEAHCDEWLLGVIDQSCGEIQIRRVEMDTFSLLRDFVLEQGCGQMVKYPWGTGLGYDVLVGEGCVAKLSDYELTDAEVATAKDFFGRNDLAGLCAAMDIRPEINLGALPKGVVAVAIPGIFGYIQPSVCDGSRRLRRPGSGTPENPEPENNDGRETCWWCSGKTHKVQGFTAEYDICPKCEK